MDTTRQYSAAGMERMMKVQDVLWKAMAKKITWWAAAEIIGVSDRTMRRWRGRLEKHGYSGLADTRAAVHTVTHADTPDLPATDGRLHWLCQSDLAPVFFFDLAPPGGVRGAGVLL